MQEIKSIAQKWGFGMAPIKPATQQDRIAAARTVRAVLTGERHAALGNLNDVSIVQGLYTRSYKRDQWDWFTVWSQLGFPSYKDVRQTSSTLKHLRNSLRDGDTIEVDRAVASLLRLNIHQSLDGFIAGTSANKPGYGFIYVLSTREMPTLLKIGYTDRDVPTRVKEINSATGVIIPFGARAAWLVPRAHSVESDVHSRLSEFRIRKDREFFQLEFPEAVRIIDSYVEDLINS